MKKTIFLTVNILLLSYLNIKANEEIIKNYNPMGLTYSIHYWACKSDTGRINGAIEDQQGNIIPSIAKINGKACFVQDINITLDNNIRLNYHFSRGNLGGYGDHTWVIRPDNTIALVN